MANVNLANLARMTVSSSGPGTITLNAAVSGFLTFDLAGCSTASAGTILRYAINDTTQSEIAYGTYTSSSVTITRGSSTTGMKSTNGNAPINMSNAAQVFITPQASDFPFVVDTGGTTAATTLAITMGGTPNPIRGTATNDSAAAGYIGEYTEVSLASTSPVALTSLLTANVTSIPLTAGDWDVEGACYAPSTSPATVQVQTALSTTSATFPAIDTNQRGGIHWGTVGVDSPLAMPQTPKVRFSLAAPTTVYLVAVAQFSGGGGVNISGDIRARRAR